MLEHADWPNTVHVNLINATASAIAQQTTGTPSYIAVGTGEKSGFYISNAKDTDTVLDATTQQQLAQRCASGTFLANTKYVMLNLQRVGTPGGSLTIELQADNGSGSPTGTALATSSAVQVNAVGTTYGWVAFPFSTYIAVASVTAGNMWMVLKSSGYAYSAGVNYLNVATITTSPPQSRAKRYNGSAWSALAATGDFLYRAVPLVSEDDTVCNGELARKAIIGRYKPANNVARLLASLLQTDANDYLTHCTLMDAATNGNVLATANILIPKTSSDLYNAYWNLTIQ